MLRFKYTDEGINQICKLNNSFQKNSFVLHTAIKYIQLKC